MKTTLLNPSFLSILFLVIILTAGSCKKDQLEVKEAKEYIEVGHVPMGVYDGPWSLILKPDGVADINPGGDVRYLGTYKISGSKIKVKSEQGSDSFTFEIISETEIREKHSGVTLALKD